MSKKIAIIGAGSIVFSTTLINDLLQVKPLEGSTLVLMGPTMEKLERVQYYTQKIIDKNGLDFKVYPTTDRREALDGADYVLAVFQIAGIEGYRLDHEIPLKYGIKQCIGQCVGPGGVMRALRTVPVMVGLLKDMEELCPDALLLNYVNPMASLSIAMGKASSIDFIGLCHGVQTTLDLIAGFVGVKKEEIDFLAAGINHMTWFLKLEKGGEDLYPILKENIEKPEFYLAEKVRCEVMRQFGYFMTESSGHLSDYLSWFRKTDAAMDLYCDQPGFGGETGGGYNAMNIIANKYLDKDFLTLESGDLEPRSKEYCSYIIEAIETGVPFQFSGNVVNKGNISNLQDGCCVEVPVYADKFGVHPLSIGALPSQLAALNNTNIAVQMLAAEAALTGDPELAVAAIAVDPYTSAVLTLKEIRDMTIELFDAYTDFLPQFEGRKPKDYPTVFIPEGTKPADTPLDPALSIVHRFGKLIEG
ncbi:MAG: alpha-galactosidase [Clostridiales bacterium]|nr:alpha-galactosidase [Clostridiales bacterium]